MALLACAVQLWTNCFWPMVGARNSISPRLLVAGFEESERKTSEAYRKVFARARFALPCAAPRCVGDVCLVFSELVLSGSVGPCGYRLHSACLTEGLRVHDLPLDTPSGALTCISSFRNPRGSCQVHMLSATDAVALALFSTASCGRMVYRQEAILLSVRECSGCNPRR